MKIEPVQVEEGKQRKTPGKFEPIGAGHYHSGLAIGAMKAGKTTTLLRVTEAHAKAGAIDLIAWHSPTARLDRKVAKVLDALKVPVIKYDDSDAVEDVLADFDAFNQEHEDYLRYKKAWAAYTRLARRGVPDDQMPGDVLDAIALGNGEPPAVAFPGHKDERPVFWYVLDDMLGSSALSTRNSAAINRLIATHRHRRINVFLGLQTFSQSLSPQLRSCMNLLMLWRNNSASVRKAMADTLSGRAEPSRFIEAWKAATEKPHDFLLVDLAKDQPFYKNAHDPLPI